VTTAPSKKYTGFWLSLTLDWSALRISHLRSEIYANVARPPGPSWRIPCCAVCC
jgi:hypothetical protein